MNFFKNTITNLLFSGAINVSLLISGDFANDSKIAAQVLNQTGNQTLAQVSGYNKKKSIKDALDKEQVKVSVDHKDLIITDAQVESCHDLSTAFNRNFLRNITRLNLSKNKLSHTPSEIKHLSNLYELDLSSNQIKEITEQDAHILASLPLGVVNYKNNQIKKASLKPLVWRLAQYLPIDVNLKKNRLSESAQEQIAKDIQLGTAGKLWTQGRIYVLYGGVAVFCLGTATLIVKGLERKVLNGVSDTIGHKYGDVLFKKIESTFSTADIAQCAQTIRDNSSAHLYAHLSDQEVIIKTLSNIVVNKVSNTSDPAMVFDRWAHPNIVRQFISYAFGELQQQLRNDSPLFKEVIKSTTQTLKESLEQCVVNNPQSSGTHLLVQAVQPFITPANVEQLIKIMPADPLKTAEALYCGGVNGALTVAAFGQNMAYHNLLSSNKLSTKLHHTYKNYTNSYQPVNVNMQQQLIGENRADQNNKKFHHINKTPEL